ncbi:MAG TPA: glycoside hydrolase family 18 protein [Chitinophagaceae bacterium]
MKFKIITAVFGLSVLAACHKTEYKNVVPTLGVDSAIVVSGYINSTKVATLDASNYQYVSRVNYYSLAPDATGAFQLSATDSANLASLKTMLTKNQQLFVTLGGTSNIANMKAMANDTTKRKNFINAVVSFCNSWSINGIDLDWDVAAVGDTTLLGQLTRKFSDTLHSTGHLLTVALNVTPTSGATSKYAIAKNLNPSVDGFNIKVYDFADGSGNQASLLQTQYYLTLFLNNNVPVNKINVCVPFYGYSATANPKYMTYSDIVTAVPTLDSAANTYSVYGFNGLKLIQDKVKYLKHNRFGGVVAWDLGQDVSASSPYSLIKSISSANAAN